VSNFPLPYKFSWLPRLLKPSLAGDTGDFGPMEQRWLVGAPTARLVFLGDISAVANREPPEIDPALREIIAAADLVVANCESPVVERAAFATATWLGTRHAMTPEFLDGVLHAAGIEPGKLMLSLANNHMLDQGSAGFDETLAELKARGISTVGTASGPAVMRVEAAPLSIGFLAFTQWRNTSEAEFARRVRMADNVAGWREQARAVDLICAAPHWDFEFRHFPQAETRELAKKLTRQGVGLIVGGHAHVVQPVERIGETLVAYGLGDFLGTVLSHTPWPLRIGAMLSVELSTEEGTRGKIAAYRAVPFLRERRPGRERLVSLEAAEGPIAGKAKQRIAAIFGDSSGGQGSQKSL
jgi:poly-gamma-glutamate capsule biosynthesis protein CapA/YwtB (metallophosphatase superfamily)